MDDNQKALERWKPVSICDGYEVSDHGRIRSIDRCILGVDGINQKRKGMLLKPTARDGGYLRVSLRWGCSNRKVTELHRLVATAFLPKKDSCDVVNHIDCNPYNNHYTNLEWCTQGDNIRHSRLLGRYPQSVQKGKRSFNASLTDNEVSQIKYLRDHGNSYQAIANVIGTSKKTVMNVCLGRTYNTPPTADTPMMNEGEK